jgi:hypothetical protein
MNTTEPVRIGMIGLDHNSWRRLSSLQSRESSRLFLLK